MKLKEFLTLSDIALYLGICTVSQFAIFVTTYKQIAKKNAIK